MFTGKKFLVVDDEPDLREILRDELEFAGADLMEAENGVLAFDLAQQNKFDAILSDIRMPGGDGMTLARKIKGQAGPKPVVFLVTGFADFTPAEAYDLGVEGFIYKPFNLGPVLENLERALEEPRARWSRTLKVNAPKVLSVTGDWKELVQSKKINLGLGGIFLSGAFAEVRKEDYVQLSLNNGFKLTGVVRWSQVADAEKGLAAGLGVELVHLSKEALEVVIADIAAKSPTAYIPRTF